MKFKKRHTLWLLVVVVLLPAIFLGIKMLQQPGYEGKRIGIWFNELAGGVFENNNRAKSTAAYGVFTRMDSNAMPFLLAQLSVDRSGIREQSILNVRKVPILSSIANKLVLPSSRRSYAGFAIRLLGTNAVESIPSLLDAWKKEPEVDVMHSIIIAMASALEIPINDIFSGEEWVEFENLVLRRVKDRHSEFFPPELVPVGKSVLKSGTKLYNSFTRRLGFTVLEVDDGYEFEDGNIGVGILVKSTNGHAVWIPRDQIKDSLMESELQSRQE